MDGYENASVMVKDLCQRLTATRIRKVTIQWSTTRVENCGGSGGSHLDNDKENYLCSGICFLIFGTGLKILNQIGIRSVF